MPAATVISVGYSAVSVLVCACGSHCQIKALITRNLLKWLISSGSEFQIWSQNIRKEKLPRWEVVREHFSN